MRLSKRTTVDHEFGVLGDRGYTGSLNDRQYKQLGDAGYRGALPDRMASSGIRRYDNFVVNNEDPALVLDFTGSDYFTNKVVSSFANSITHEATTNATMVDSDGLLKWRPHNLALNSATPATQSITVVSGADYTVECTGVSIALSGASTGTVTEGSPVEITASTTTLTLTVTGSTGTMWCYRSDLGGMVDNPDRGDSYVPTTTSARYLPRIGHHVYNGSQWVDEGVFHESEARTNLITYSEDFTGAGWADEVSVVLTTGQSKWAGEADATQVDIVDVGDYIYYTATVSASTVYTTSWWIKLGTATQPVYGFYDASNSAWIDRAQYTVSNFESYGGGWFRVHFNVTTPSGCTSLRVYPIRENDGSPVAGALGTYVIYGAQFEAGSTPSSYIPTSGATVTRAADTLTIPAANLPWPEPVVIGEELVTNGTFDTDSDWTKGTGWSISGGKASFSNPTGTSLAQVGLPTMEAGKVYLLSFDMDYTSGAGCTVGINVGGGIDTFGTFNSTATHVAVVVPTIDRTGISITGIGTSIFSIDNISVREIKPRSVSIQMHGYMSYGDSGSSAEMVLFRIHPDTSNNIIAYLSTFGADVGAIDFVQRIGGVYDVSGTAADAYSPGVNVPFNIAGRFLDNAIQGAADGVATTENTTPVGLPDLSTTDLDLGYDFMGTIKTFRMWADDIGDAGIVEASAPSLEPSLSLTFDGSSTSFTVFDWSE